MIFDSDVVIWDSRGGSKAASWINAVSDPAMSAVTLMEVLQGTRSIREMQQTRQLIRVLQFRVLPLSEAIGDAATALIEEHALSSGLQVADALIAATALDRLEIKAFRPRRH